MFNLFKSRPPIIIINEAERHAPTPVIQKKTWWAKFSGVVYVITVFFHFAVLITILMIMTRIQQNAVQANDLLLRQLRVSDSLYNAATLMHYYDSINVERHYAIADSVHAVSFQLLSHQLNEMVKQNKMWQKKYQERLPAPQPNTSLR
ncbi:hypothetical protein FRZ67_11390 [Panacibacter ginsenosidivorans]|uniref:Uncharacterized protein n=1 Tax=Panacibacter ginsenosidivorans TaxID=1813871 RepID=A0A5B8VA94_9BACT|nr:hypothetical protein [Panacibacter ginsenosidivorans]QEC67873.1 hypothetical protein FRZ67_11390 [Panacibacter ginsenosidivorans]